MKIYPRNDKSGGLHYESKDIPELNIVLYEWLGRIHSMGLNVMVDYFWDICGKGANTKPIKTASMRLRGDEE